MNLLNEIRSDLKILGYKTKFYPIGSQGKVWRLVLNYGIDEFPRGYYVDFRGGKADDNDFVAQFLLIMYAKAAKKVSAQRSGKSLESARKLEEITFGAPIMKDKG